MRLWYSVISFWYWFERREKTYLSEEIVASAHGVDEASISVFGCVKLLQQGAGAPLRNLVFNNNQSVWKQNNSLESSSPKYRQRSSRTQLPSVSESHNLLFYHNYNTSNITTCCAACSLFLFWAKIGCFFLSDYLDVFFSGKVLWSSEEGAPMTFWILLDGWWLSKDFPPTLYFPKRLIVIVSHSRRWNGFDHKTQ